jgi:hypothetical protein
MVVAFGDSRRSKRRNQKHRDSIKAQTLAPDAIPASALVLSESRGDVRGSIRGNVRANNATNDKTRRAVVVIGPVSSASARLLSRREPLVDASSEGEVFESGRRWDDEDTPDELVTRPAPERAFLADWQ